MRAGVFGGERRDFDAVLLPRPIDRGQKESRSAADIENAAGRAFGDRPQLLGDILEKFVPLGQAIP